MEAEGQAVGREMDAKVRSVTLLQWMGLRSWANKAEAQREPERLEKALRDGHFAWFRVATGEGVPSSRCWMVFNAGENSAYWGSFGVTRMLCVRREGVRGHWSEDGKRWWRVEECRGTAKRVRVERAVRAYRAACGALPWEMPFFDGSEKNRARLERMYDHVARVLGCGSMDEGEVDRLLDRAETAVGFSRWAVRGMLYGGHFWWEKGEAW